MITIEYRITIIIIINNNTNSNRLNNIGTVVGFEDKLLYYTIANNIPLVLRPFAHAPICI